MTAVLAKVTGQPVKLEFTREDDYIGMHGRWSSEQHYKIGVKNDGTITAVQLDAVTNMGAYRKQSGNLSGTDFYQIPNFKKVDQAGAYQHGRRRQLPRAGLSAICLRLCVVPRSDRLRARDQSARDVHEEPYSHVQEQDSLSLPTISNNASSKDPSASAGARNGTNLGRCPVRKSMASAWL